MPGLIRQKMSAWSAIFSSRGSTTMIVVPRLRAPLKKLDATGWFAVVLEPATIATSAFSMSPYVVETAPDPTPSSSAATDDAWQSRVQWSTLLVPKPARISFWNRYASSLLHLAEPKPASDPDPCCSLIARSREAARSSASSQVASRKWGSTSS